MQLLQLDLQKARVCCDWRSVALTFGWVPSSPGNDHALASISYLWHDGAVLSGQALR